jgi:hypothetical protein
MNYGTIFPGLQKYIFFSISNAHRAISMKKLFEARVNYQEVEYLRL